MVVVSHLNNLPETQLGTLCGGCTGRDELLEDLLLLVGVLAGGGGIVALLPGRGRAWGKGSGWINKWVSRLNCSHAIRHRRVK